MYSLKNTRHTTKSISFHWKFFIFCSQIPSGHLCHSYDAIDELPTSIINGGVHYYAFFRNSSEIYEPRSVSSIINTLNFSHNTYSYLLLFIQTFWCIFYLFIVIGCMKTYVVLNIIREMLDFIMWKFTMLPFLSLWSSHVSILITDVNNDICDVWQKLGKYWVYNESTILIQIHTRRVILREYDCRHLWFINN